MGTPDEIVPKILLVLLGSVVLGIVTMSLFIRHWVRKKGHLKGIPEGLFPPQGQLEALPISSAWSGRGRPRSWIAIKGRKVEAVEKALDLERIEVCGWEEGLDHAEENGIFIAPPVDDWILVFGDFLPDPEDDIDACFRVLSDLSAKIGQIQYFQRDPILSQHAWVKMNYGKVVRAYVWAGETLWNQGRPTPVEAMAGVHCLNYGDNVSGDSFSVPDSITANVDKVAVIASRWSLDPATIDDGIFDTSRGITCNRKN